MFKEQIDELKADRSGAHSALERLETQGATAGRVDTDKLVRFRQISRSDTA